MTLATEPMVAPEKSGFGPVAKTFRVEMFSDAVFAVAITLLALDLRVPETSTALVSALAQRWPTFVAFAISFVIVGCLWMNHHRCFKLVRAIDSKLALINLALLMFVILVPFGASLIATFVTKSDSQSHLAAAVFSAIMLLMGLTFSILHRRIARQQRDSQAASSARRWRDGLDSAFGPIVNGASIGIAFVSPVTVLILIGAVALYYLSCELRN
jgi:uncharacterized membrane protein